MKRLFLIAACAALFTALWAFPSPESSGAWTIDAGDPTDDGSAAFVIEVKYTDPETTQRLTKEIEVKLPNVLEAWTANDKADAIANALAEEAAKEENKVGDESLVDTARGLGETAQVAPAADNPGTPGEAGTGAVDVSIEKVKAKDKHTDEDDVVIKPVDGQPGVNALVAITMSGDITGQDSHGQVSHASVGFGGTDFEIALSGSDTRKGVALKWEGLLRAAGFDATYSSEFRALFVVVPSGVHGVSVGSSDIGIEIAATTMVTR